MNQKGIAGILVIILIVVIFFAVFVFAQKIAEDGSKNSKNSSSSKSIIGQQYLISEVPNFERLATEYLPNFNDIREVEDYSDNIIVSGFNRVVEYDPKTEKVLRQNTQIIPNMSDTAIIGDFLYLVGASLDNKLVNSPGKYHIYIVSLRTGEVVDTLLDKYPLDFVNLNIAAKEGYLYGASWDGIFQIDPRNSSLKLLSNYDSVTKLVVESSNLVGYGYGKKFIFNETTQKFEEEEDKSDELLRLVNSDADDFGLNLPKYLAISELINDKYYIFSKDKVFTLKEREFPEFVKNLSSELNENSLGHRILVDDEERYALLTGSIGAKGGDGYVNKNPPVKDHLFINLVDLSTGTQHKLLEYSPIGNKPYYSSGYNNSQFVNDMLNGIILESRDGFVIKNVDEEEIMKIDVNKKTLTIDKDYLN